MKNKINKRLLQYTSIVGTSAFALSTTAEAVLQPLDSVPGSFSIASGRASDNFDVNGDGLNDLQFRVEQVFSVIDGVNTSIGQRAVINDIGDSVSFDAQLFDPGIIPGPGIDTGYYLNPFDAGVTVDGNLSGQLTDNGIVSVDTTLSGFDAWEGNSDTFHAFSFNGSDGETRFAWLAVSINNDNGELELIINDGAYDDEAGTAVVTGVTIPEPSTYALGLGLLAAGAAGIRARRRMKKLK